MKIILNKLIKWVLLTCILFFLIFDLFIGLEHKSILSPYIDTKFASDFSIDNFNQLKMGDKYSKVLKSLGPPIRFSKNIISSIQPDKAIFIGVYSTDGKCNWSDFAWKSFDIYFDKDTVVIGKNSNWWYD
jgi:hypothetical protein